MKTIRYLAVFFFISGITLSGQPAQAEELRWIGCGISKNAFMEHLAEAYEQLSGVKVILETGNVTEGIQAVANRQADLGGSCRDREAGDPRESEVKMLPIAWDALVMAVHPDNPLDSITLSQLRGIYLGEITNWKEVGGPDQTITVFAPARLSGIGYMLRKYLYFQPDTEFRTAKEYPVGAALEDEVARNPDAIAIAASNAATGRGVKLLKLNGVEPTYDNVKSGDYQLFRPIYLVANAFSRDAKVDAFLKYAFSKNGSDAIRASGSIPYLEGIRLPGIQRELMRQLGQ